MKFKMFKRTLDIPETLICAILNVTPDSFSDGGQHNQLDQALAKAKSLIDQGADMLDIGGESTRPGSTYVEIEEEIKRVVPVIEGIRQFSDIPISVDTWKAEVAQACLEAGADVINDITGLLGDPAMAGLVAESGAGLILMFNPVKIRPDHPESARFPAFGQEAFSPQELANLEGYDIVSLMDAYLDKSLAVAQAAGIEADQIMLDPGIGFGLTVEENLTLINQLDQLQARGYMTYLGVSRKRFIASLVAQTGLTSDYQDPEGLHHVDMASASFTTLAAQAGIEAVRVHSVQEHLIARQMGQALRRVALSNKEE